jgi:hypothetical protein
MKVGKLVRYNALGGACTGGVWGTSLSLATTPASLFQFLVDEVVRLG